MRRLLAVAAAVLTAVAVPAWAQHGGGGHGGGGFSGHSSGAERGGFSGGGQFRSSGGALRQGYRPAERGFAPESVEGAGPGVAVTAPIAGSGFAGAHAGFYGRRGRDRWGYGYAGVPYVYPGVYSGWDGYDLGFDDDGDYDNSAESPANGYGPGEGYEAGPGYGPDYGPADGPVEGYPQGPAEGYGEQPPVQTQEDAAQDTAAALAQDESPALYDADAVTLVFKDGRPPEKIQNYALTRTTLYVTGEHHREIPVADLDIAATERANRDAGVSFQLPSGQ